MGALAVVLVLAACGGGSSGAASADRILVAAASDLRVAFDELATTYGADSGVEVVVTYGASGQLATQIDAGAPFDVFASADVAYAEELVASGRADGATLAPYAVGQVVLVGRGPDARVEDLVSDAVTRIAIANPEYAPYGRAARQALQSAGVWEALDGRIVFGANVADALRLVESGEVDAALVARSLVDDATRGGWRPIPSGTYDAPVQAIVVTAAPDAPNRRAAEGFATFVRSPEGQRVLAGVGFAPPPASSPGRPS